MCQTNTTFAITSGYEKAARHGSSNFMAENKLEKTVHPGSDGVPLWAMVGA
jgi:hypothetical protein